VLRPGIDGVMRPGTLSAADRSAAMLREARDLSTDTISSYLSAAGFDGIPSNGPVILHAITSGARSVVDLAKFLAIPEQEMGKTINALAQHGYVQYQTDPPARGRALVILTERGRAANGVAMHGFKAARWTDFPFRPGDIVISTWPKTGTTWAQMICALLIFQTPKLPAPLSELSPWPDLSTISRDEVYAWLAAQEHRRIIKTHLHLRDISVDPRATYITVGRHPLDSALSLYHQNNNKVPRGADGTLPRPEERPHPSPSERDWLLQWIDTAPGPHIHYHYLAEMLRHLSAAWTLRQEPNVVLMHYADLSANLAGEMRRLAARLDISVPEATWPDLVQAATFKHMQANPDRFVPSGIAMKDNASFFRSGVSGEGRALLTGAELARYHARVAQLASPDMLAWLHHDEGHG
jgi:aryl sulfotransferase